MMNKYLKIAYVLLMLATIPTLSFAKNSGSGIFQLQGYIINGNTCQAIAGATISTDYTGATNVSNAKGFYTLTLGSGVWNLTVSAPGYVTQHYSSPSLKNGVSVRNYSISQVGQQPGPCSAVASNSYTTTSIAPVSTTSTSTTNMTNSTSSSTGASGLSSTTLAEIAVVIVVVIVILAYLFMKPSKK